jgi:tRNA(fMet)-specific endonuclease VapC
LKFLLDTNICIFVIKQKPIAVLQRFSQYSSDELGISTITLAELRYGADKSSNPSRNHSALDLFLSPLAIMDFDSECSEYYGKVMAELERCGRPIGPLDTMIAAHALRLRVPVVTNNTKEFARVSGLVIEDWSK